MYYVLLDLIILALQHRKTLGNIIFSMRSPFVLSTSFSKIKLVNQQSHGANEELQGRRGKRKRSDTNTG